MAVDSELTYKTWCRYAHARDNGHLRYVEKADKCERFFAGDQWDPEDLAKLKAVRRPALTINKIISTVSNVLGEQIYNRSEISFQPRSGAPQETATVLTKVFKQISDNNQLNWKRSDMFADGIITSRGYIDMRLGYNDSSQGEIVLTTLNPRNVIPDPDAEDYDPDTWSEVFMTKWMTADDIAVMYSKEDAEILRHSPGSSFPYGYDSIDMNRGRFGEDALQRYAGDYDESNVMRNIRVIERQYRMLHNQKHFLSPETGDMRAIPEEFSRNRIAWFVEKYGFKVVPKLVRRIKWLVMADNVVLHHDWSPYKHFTVIPYFPYFRHGKTIGLVENLLGSQELLNKVSSQELHVINTTANSGWKVKAGALLNMSPAELEEKGAQTGVVLELNEMDGAEKITPNAVPTGLDRVSYKAEEHIKTISGVSDSMQGFDREDVAAKAIQEKKKSGSTNLVKPLDNLARTDFFIARNGLDLIQGFYTAERVLTITHDNATQDSETFTINQPNPENPVEFLNDLTVGEYGVVVTSVPMRETMEDSQFDQAVAMREMGVMIPDSTIIESSRLINKKDIIKQMEGDKTSPEAQEAAELQRRGQAAEVAKAEGEAAQKHADAGLKQAKTQETTVKAQVLANTPIEDPSAGGAAETEMDRAQKAHEMEMKERELQHKERMDLMEQARKRREMEDKLALQARESEMKRIDARNQAAQQAAQAAQKPAPASKV
jgi:hypothetical protein